MRSFTQRNRKELQPTQMKEGIEAEETAFADPPWSLRPPGSLQNRLW